MKPTVSSRLLNKARYLKEYNSLDHYTNNYDPKQEEQHILDCLLKTSLPIIWHHIDIFKTEHCASANMLRHIPEDFSEIVLEGKWSLKVCKGRNVYTHRPYLYFKSDHIEIPTKFTSLNSAKCKYHKHSFLS